MQVSEIQIQSISENYLIDKTRVAILVSYRTAQDPPSWCSGFEQRDRHPPAVPLLFLAQGSSTGAKMGATSVDGMSPRSWLARRSVSIVNGVSRRLGRGSGTVAGGRVGLKLDPDLLGELTATKDVVVVSGTNGKTTTTALVAAALREPGWSVATNETGSNMPPGHVAALVAMPNASRVVLEVDESYVPRVVAETKPRAVVLLNLSRDQLDRTNEVRMIAQRWRLSFEGEAGFVVVANADDPLVVFAASSASHVIWVAAGLVWRDDATACPECQGAIIFHDASWRCSTCTFQRPDPTWVLEGYEIVGPTSRATLSLALPGAFNELNALEAAAAAAVLGISLDDAVARMATVHDVAGRFHLLDRNGASTRVMLAKNPAGWSALLDLVQEDELPVVIGINARTADGADPSWLFDVPFERLAGRKVIATGDRWRDLSVRLHYAEVDHVSIEGPLAAIDAAHDLGGGLVDYIGNYTAFQDVMRSTS